MPLAPVSAVVNVIRIGFERVFYSEVILCTAAQSGLVGRCACLMVLDGDPPEFVRHAFADLRVPLEQVIWHADDLVSLTRQCL